MSFIWEKRIGNLFCPGGESICPQLGEFAFAVFLPYVGEEYFETADLVFKCVREDPQHNSSGCVCRRIEDGTQKICVVGDKDSASSYGKRKEGRIPDPFVCSLDIMPLVLEPLDEASPEILIG